MSFINLTSLHLQPLAEIAQLIDVAEMLLSNRQGPLLIKSRVSVSSVLSATRALIKSAGRVKLHVPHTLSSLLEKRTTKAKASTKAPQISTTTLSAFPYSHVRVQVPLKPASAAETPEILIFTSSLAEQDASLEWPEDQSPLGPSARTLYNNSSASSDYSLSIQLPTDSMSRDEHYTTSSDDARDSDTTRGGPGDMIDDNNQTKIADTPGRSIVSTGTQEKIRRSRRSGKYDPTRRYGVFFDSAEDLMEAFAQFHSEELKLV